VVRKGGRSRLGRSRGILRISHLLFLGVCAVMMVLDGLQSQRWVFVYLVSYRVDDIDMLDGRSGFLCERLCCVVVVASDLRACGAFVWLTVYRLFSRLNYYL